MRKLKKEFKYNEHQENIITKLHISADSGDIKAMFNYGVNLENGEGFVKSASEASRYYKMAAD